MRFQPAGACASLLLLARVAAGAALGNTTTTHASATPSLQDSNTRDSHPDKTVPATVVPDSSAPFSSATGLASNAQGPPPPAPIANANSTVPTPASEQLTTLTVLSTQVRTVISCAPTVTNCPADSSSLSDLASTAPEQVSTVLVTDVVQLATTICPVTAAEAISSSVISVAATGGITGTTITPSAGLPGALPTGIPSPSGPGAGARPQPSGQAGNSSTISAHVPPESAAAVPSGPVVPPGESSSPEKAAPTGALPQPPSNGTVAKPFPIGNSSIPLVQEVTSTVFSTRLHTITSCAASITNCPAGSSVSTEVVPVSTTVVKASSPGRASISSAAAITAAPEPTPAPPGGEQTTLTVKVTHIHTVISCAPTITDCPAATNTKGISAAISSHGTSAVQPVIVTSIVGETVTVCPVAEASSISSQVGASLSSAVVTTTVNGSASFFIPSASSAQTPAVPQTPVQATPTPAQEQSASSSVAAVAESSSTAVFVSVSPVVSVITITLSDGFERTSTSSLQVTSTVTKVVPVHTPAPGKPGGQASEVVSNVISTIYKTVTSQIPVETVLTVTVGGQILTSTISTSAAVQTPEISSPPQVSTVYVTVGSGPEASVMTSTFTASEVVAKDTQTLTLTGSAGVVSTYTLTLSQATTVTQEAPKPTGLGDAASACVPSTVTLISVSTLCARSGNACATATNLPLAMF